MMPKPSTPTIVRAACRLAAGVALILAFSARPAAAQWSVTPYIWASSIDLDVTLADRPVVDEHIAFTDLIEDVEVAVMLRVEADYGRFGGMVDFFHVDMATGPSEVTLPGGVPATLASDIGMSVIDAVGSYALSTSGPGLSVTAGVRMLGENAEVTLQPQGAPSGQQSSVEDFLVDGIVGGRYQAQVARHWSLDIRADVGTGGTELTWSAGGDVAYGLGASQKFAATAGYRYLLIEFKDDTPAQVTMAMSGFVAGLRYTF